MGHLNSLKPIFSPTTRRITRVATSKRIESSSQTPPVNSYRCGWLVEMVVSETGSPVFFWFTEPPSTKVLCVCEAKLRSAEGDHVLKPRKMDMPPFRLQLILLTVGFSDITWERMRK